MEIKCYAACLEQEGLQEVEMVLVGTSAYQLVDLITKGVHRTGDTTLSLPLGLWHPLQGSDRLLPSGVDLFLERTCHSPTTMMPLSPKEEEPALQVSPMQMGPLRPLLPPWEDLHSCGFFQGTSSTLLNCCTDTPSQGLQAYKLKGFWQGMFL